MKKVICHLFEILSTSNWMSPFDRIGFDEDSGITLKTDKKLNVNIQANLGRVKNPVCLNLSKSEFVEILVKSR